MKKRIVFYTVKVMGSKIVECKGIDNYIDEYDVHNKVYKIVKDKIIKDKFIRVNNEKDFDIVIVMSSYIKEDNINGGDEIEMD